MIDKGSLEAKQSYKYVDGSLQGHLSSDNTHWQMDTHDIIYTATQDIDGMNTF